MSDAQYNLDRARDHASNAVVTLRALFPDADADDIAKAAISAAAPWLRRRVADEIAAEIERHADLWEEGENHPAGSMGARRAASIAREVGVTKFDESGSPIL